MTPLKACPNYGKKQGKLADRSLARFPYALVCGACGWTTAWVRLPGVAEKLWNEAKKPKREVKRVEKSARRT